MLKKSLVKTVFHFLQLGDEILLYDEAIALENNWRGIGIGVRKHEVYEQSDYLWL